MTKHLYDLDSHLTQHSAVVIACSPAEQGFDVVLDQTALFPEGGGQPSDTGTIGEAVVLHVREEGGEIFHRVDRALPVGREVPVRLDWARRFDLMQQHTGEHLLSFSFFHLFSAANVGFHLALDYATIDFDKPLSHEQVLEAERLSNTFVWRNLPVSVTFYESDAEVQALPLRKRAEGLQPPIRIVSIQDADLCTCCAPHCAQTGEIGLVFVSDAISYKGGTRITFLCGARALARTRAVYDDMDTLARRFSTARENAVGAVQKLSEDYGALKKRERELVRSLNGYLSQELAASAVPAGRYRLIVRLVSEVDAGRLKDLAQVSAGPKTLVLLLSLLEDRLAYVLASGEGFELDVSELMPAVNAATGGKGGGRGTLAQGMAPSSGGAAETAEQLKHYFIRRLSDTK